VSRRNPTIMVWVTAAMVALNVGLNVALIPSLDDTGAALAMLVTEAVLLVIALTIAVRTVGGVRWVSTAVSPLVAGAAMAAPMLLLQDTLVPAALAGTAVYALVFIGLERVISPVDLRFVGSMLRRRLTGRAAT
jgi:peptidoglycan biosynthesis protein MviN/MurJ (putative lipid II flippase)